MSDSRVEKLAAHYARATHPNNVGSPTEDVRKEAAWYIADLEAAGLIVANPDDIDVAAVSRLARNAYIHAAPVPLNNKWMAVMAAVLEALKVTR